MFMKFSTITSALREALFSRGVNLNSIIEDGQIHRFDVPDKPRGNRSGWYVCPTPQLAVFGFWHTGERQTVTLANEYDPIATQQARQAAANVLREREALRKMEQDQTADRALKWWSNSQPADSYHPYLLKKGVRANGLRQHGNTLLVPLYNNLELVNLQQIFLDGNKRFMKGGMVKGVASIIGGLAEASHVYLSEGWATAATIHEATGCPVVAAMTANNLPVVAITLRRYLSSETSITIAADNDRRTKNNPGLRYGQQAATKIGASITWPRFPCERCNCSDFNDLDACEKRQGVSS
ncbi:toprim domain-containing protein [Vreelandella indica]|uniref:toprim domain-containing protein n=1 Tax=Vreelandella indica TaxID=3126500 RepID=UPI00300E5583